jgi:cob(I)alamin adenosyltransferase
MGNSMRKGRGLIIVYTGHGKGKTTAAFGLALRAAGHGMRVLIVQFMKGQKEIGEMKAVIESNIQIDVIQAGRPGFVQSRTCESLDIYMALEGLRAVERAMESNAYKIIVLDEINVAIDFGLLEVEEVLTVINKKPPGVHLVLTGRNAPEPILEIADIVTEMKNLKHCFTNGVAGQKGIEY